MEKFKDFIKNLFLNFNQLKFPLDKFKFFEYVKIKKMVLTKIQTLKFKKKIKI